VADLETVDIPAVEVLSTGGPVHGVGSPPEGDYWTRDQLEAMAAAARELAAEIKPPNKIGHSDASRSLRNSALAVPTPGEMPAVGWLDGSTARVVDGDDGVEAVLVMDAKAVPGSSRSSSTPAPTAPAAPSCRASRARSPRRRTTGS
jgi:hypothetical protein